MQERSKETRARILQVALNEFSIHGYEATGVAEICEAAGVSKGAFYHHFKSKQAVFLELLRSWLTQIDLQMQATRAASQSVPQSLMTMTGLMQQIYLAADAHLPMFLEFWAQARRDPLVWQTVIDPYRRYQEYFAAMIQEGIDEGSFRSDDPQSAARALVALAVGLLLQGMLDPLGADWPAVTQQSLRLFIKSLSTEGQ